MRRRERSEHGGAASVKGVGSAGKAVDSKGTVSCWGIHVNRADRHQRRRLPRVCIARCGAPFFSFEAAESLQGYRNPPAPPIPGVKLSNPIMSTPVKGKPSSPVMPEPLGIGQSESAFGAEMSERRPT